MVLTLNLQDCLHDCCICFDISKSNEIPIQLNFQNIYIKTCKCNVWVHINCLEKWFNENNSCLICCVKMEKKEIEEMEEMEEMEEKERRYLIDEEEWNEYTYYFIIIEHTIFLINIIIKFKIYYYCYIFYLMYFFYTEINIHIK